MDDAPAPLARIDAAIARIEAATDLKARDRAALARRHAVLRERVGEAVAALDGVLAAERG